MKKNIKTFGAFATAAAAKNLKASAAHGLHCYTENAGAPNNETVYLFDGYTCLILGRHEYEAIARPITNRDPGAWILEKTEARPADKKALVEKAIIAPSREASYCFTVAPLTFEDSETGNPIAALYSREADIAIVCNANYLASFAPGTVFKSAGKLHPIFAFDGDRLTGLVMPIRPRPEIERTVRACFAEENKTAQKSSVVSDLEMQLAALQSDALAYKETAEARIAELTAELDARAARIAELEASAIAPDPIEETPDPLADIPAVFHPIAAAALAIDGIELTVKGAKTEKPILWLTGETYTNRGAIKALGLKYSNKRRAWYIAAADVKAIAVAA